MSTLNTRWFLIAVWVVCAIGIFSVSDAPDMRAWSIFAVAALLPPVMLLWLWNEDGPAPLGTLREAARR